MSTLNIAIIQASLAWHDAAANRAAFAEQIGSLDRNLDLIVLPEMFSTGFTMAASAQAETMDGASVAWLHRMAEDSGAAVCGSLIINDNGQYFNRFILASPDGQRQVYDKRHLFRLAGECEEYAAGKTLVTIELKGWRIRPMICYDLRFPVWSRRSRQQDFDLLLYVANWPKPRHQAWETLLRARAIENQCYVIGVNRVGEDGNDLPYAGGSAVVDFYGNETVKLGMQAATATAQLERAAMQRFRDRFPFDVDADSFEITGGPTGR